MLDIGMPQTGIALEIGSRYLSAAQARWERLTASDYARIKSIDELIAAVAERYGLPRERARTDVRCWLSDVGYRPFSPI